MDQNNDVDQFEVDRWVRHRERALEHKWYSLGRIDVLLISVSAGGIYTCFEVIKFIKLQELPTDYLLLKISGYLYALAIIANFASQNFAVFAHRNESKWTILKLGETRKKSIDKSQMDKFDKKSKFNGDLVEYSNIASIAAMLLGVFLTSTFIALYF